MAIVKTPRFSLPDAIERVRLIYNSEGTNLFDDLVAVKQMGYSALSGASRSMLGAVRGYGLIVGRGSSMQVSDDAVVILADENAEDQSERQEALLRCLKHNRIYAELYERFGNTASEMNATSYLQKTHKMNPDAASRTAKSYKDSVAIVYLEVEVYPEGDDGSDQSDASNGLQPEGGGADPRISPQTAHPLELAANMRQETFTLEGSKSVTIQFPDQMSADDFEDFKDWLAILERKVGRTVDRRKSPEDP